VLGRDVAVVLDRHHGPPPAELLHAPKINPGHHEAAREGVAVTVPRIALDAPGITARGPEGHPRLLHDLGEELVRLGVRTRRDLGRGVVGARPGRTSEFMGTCRECPGPDAEGY